PPVSPPPAPPVSAPPTAIPPVPVPPVSPAPPPLVLPPELFGRPPEPPVSVGSTARPPLPSEGVPPFGARPPTPDEVPPAPESPPVWMVDSSSSATPTSSPQAGLALTIKGNTNRILMVVFLNFVIFSAFHSHCCALCLLNVTKHALREGNQSATSRCKIPASRSDSPHRSRSVDDQPLRAWQGPTQTMMPGSDWLT